MLIMLLVTLTIVIKTKLLKWYEKSKERREAGSKAMFTRAV